MTDWTRSLVLPHGAVTITPNTIHSVGAAAGTFGLAASATWVTANAAIYVPFRIAQPLTVVKLFMLNGAAVSGNVDVGIYGISDAGTPTRMVSSGSTAQSGVSVIQEFNITDTLIGPGLFYLALAVDNTTATFLRQVTLIANLELLGAAQQATAFPLPATATFAVVTSSYLPMFGLTGRVVV